MIKQFLQGKPYKITSSTPGKNILVTVAMHGDEYAGVLMVQKILQEGLLVDRLQSGSVSFVLGNVQAHNVGVRYINDDMNRIRSQSMQESSYEYHRKKTLQALMNDADLLLDIHSTSQDTQIVGICDKDHIVTDFLDVDVIIADPVEQTGCSLLGIKQGGGVGFGIEVGHHDDPNAVALGLHTVENMLIHYGMMRGTIQKTHQLQGVFAIKEEIVPNTNDFALCIDYDKDTYVPVAPGMLFAHDGAIPVRNDHDTTMYLGMVPPVVKKGVSAGFLFEKLS